MKKVNGHYLKNVELKITKKVDILNSMLCVKFVHRIPEISTNPIVIIEMDASHNYPSTKGN